MYQKYFILGSMSILEQLQIIIPFSLMFSVNITACCLIGSYIKKKPTGLQTLLDKLIFILIIVDVIFCIDIFAMTYFLIFLVPFATLTAKIIFYTQSFIFNFFLCWFIIVIVVKYLCIFHPDVLETGYTDQELVEKISIYAILILASVFGIEHAFLVEIEYFSIYQVLSSHIPEDGKQGMTKVSLFLHFLSIASITFTQFQIERKRLKTLHSGMNIPEIIAGNAGNIAEDQVENADLKCLGSKKSICFIRLVTILTIAISICSIIIIFDLDFSSSNLKLLLHGSIIMMLYCIIPPLLYIIKTENLKIYATNYIKNMCN